MTETARPEDLLTRVGLFAALGRVELAKLAAYLDPLELAIGDEVFRQGETGDSLYVVASGALGVFVVAANGGSTLRVGTLTSGDLFGEMALFTGEPRSATIRADSPSTILQLPRERFLALVVREPTISLTIAATLSQRLRSANEARVEHAGFMATAIDTALRQMPPARRDTVLEASLLDSPAAAVLQAAFGAQAVTVAADLATVGVDGRDASTALHVLRERLERAIGRPALSAHAEALA